MTAGSVIPFLRDFGQVTSVSEERLNPVGDLPSTPSQDVDAEVLSAEFERGVREGRAELEATVTEAVERTRSELTVEHQAEREQWVAEQADVLGACIEDALSETRAHLSDTVARVLQPILLSAVRQRALEAFANTVCEIVGGSSMEIHLKGPEDLITAVSNHFESKNFSIHVTCSDETHLSVTVDDTRITSNLAKWTAAIEEVNQ